MFRMRRRKRFQTCRLSATEKLVSCLELCQELSRGPWKAWLAGCLAVLLLITAWHRLFIYDPCDSVNIKTQLCEQYRSGDASGGLCYALCEENAPFFSYCLSADEKSFLLQQTIFKTQSGYESEAWWNLSEGMAVSDLRKQVVSFLQQKLGHSVYHNLVERLLAYADFNEDGKLSLSEGQSIWRLIHIQEFLLLFIFQKSSTFPNINGTCGHVYGFQHTPFSYLYDKNAKTWVSKLFANSYKWDFPNWAKRARISLGMVEFSMDLYEEEETRFLMCDISPRSFGITYSYEAMVTSISDVVSEDYIRRYLEAQSCQSDFDCYYKKCSSKCDMTTGTCLGKVNRPSLWFVCDIMQEYLLFDSPKHLHYELKQLLDKCSQLSTMDPSVNTKHAVLYHDLKAFLWKEIQYNPKA